MGLAIMSDQLKQNAIRRSTRLPLEIPVLVASLDVAFDFSEECTTTLVNAHGCGLIARRALSRGLRVRLEMARSKRQTNALVADVVPLGGNPETWLVGIEFDTPGNFWGLEYPPSDWKIAIDTPPAPPLSQAPPEPATVTKTAPAARRWTLTDISAGACYLEHSEPLPLDALVLISVRTGSTEFLVDGVVRASHPHTGMGVEFTSPSGNHRARVEELVGRLVESREVPRVFVGRKEGAAGAETIFNRVQTGSADDETPDLLLDLVRSGNSLPTEEFRNALKAQRINQQRHVHTE